ncbi:MAG: hypothetical protein Q8936_03205 [Bacillota bacterium]|nr:hypothetical protein [Bacillota bacterium]
MEVNLNSCVNEKFVSFLEYLKNERIYVIGENEIFKEEDQYSEEQVLNQIKTITVFHKAACNYREQEIRSIKSGTGKLIEKYKLNTKTVKYFLRNLNGNSKNEFENMLIQYSNQYMARAEKCLEAVKRINYVSLIRRSMQNNEICIGNSYFTNLVNMDQVKIFSLKECKYDIVEMDCVYLLGKLKRRGIKLNWLKLAKEFCILEQLNNNSEDLITSLVSFPHEYMKCCVRYIKNKKQWTIDEYMENMLKAIEKDGLSLI